ncbi:hypothetical protein ACOMHN_035282 [Nucella lapillus]
MSNLVEEEVTLEDLATMCAENHEELADLILQEVPFYHFTKTTDNAVPHMDTTAAETQVTHFLDYNVAMTTDITDIAQEETCCSNDCYNAEVPRSPDSEGSVANLSPHGRKKCTGSRKIRTPNTLQHMMEKHRHSERKRHHSLNERLKTICKLIPGSALENRETKVVMMQRVISYIAYLENSIHVLCQQMGLRPHSSWVLLTTAFTAYFHDYFKGIEDADMGDEEVLAATHNLSQSMKETEEEDSFNIVSKVGHQRKVSSPTVDSTTDSVVPIMQPPPGVEMGEKEEEELLSSGVGELWALYQSAQEMPGTVGTGHGDAEVFFRSSMDDGVSAILEISSSTAENQDKPLFLGLGEDYRQEADLRKTTDNSALCRPHPPTSPHPSPVEKSLSSLYTIQKHIPDTVIHRRNKRKQLSPRRSALRDDYLSDKAYLPSWSTSSSESSAQGFGKEGSCSKVQRVVPYNIRCNHRHPVQRLQASGAKLGINPISAPLYIPPAASQKPDRERASEQPQEKVQSTKLDLRKTSWMNGFMMFSRLNRSKFIQAHPGVHTSHISKIMGHAWRNMTKEDQAPYREKAQVCAKELYRMYTSNLPVSQSSAVDTASDTTTTTADNTHTLLLPTRSSCEP